MVWHHTTVRAERISRPSDAHPVSKPPIVGPGPGRCQPGNSITRARNCCPGVVGGRSRPRSSARGECIHHNPGPSGPYQSWRARFKQAGEGGNVPAVLTHSLQFDATCPAWRPFARTTGPTCAPPVTDKVPAKLPRHRRTSPPARWTGTPTRAEAQAASG